MKADTSALSQCDIIFKKTTTNYQGACGESKLVFQTFLQALARVVLSSKILAYFDPPVHPPKRPHNEYDENDIENCCEVAIQLLRKAHRLEPPPPATDLLTDDAVLAFQENEELLHRVFYYYTRHTDYLMSYEKLLDFSKDFAIFPNLLNKAILLSLYRAISPELRALTYPGFIEFLGRASLWSFSRPGLVENHAQPGDKIRGMFARLRVCHKMTHIVADEESKGSVRTGKLPDHVIWGESEMEKSANIANLAPKKSFGTMDLDAVGQSRLHRSSTFRKQNGSAIIHEASNVQEWSSPSSPRQDNLEPIPEKRKAEAATNEGEGSQSSEGSSVEQVTEVDDLDVSTGIREEHHQRTTIRSQKMSSSQQYNSLSSSVEKMSLSAGQTDSKSKGTTSSSCAEVQGRPAISPSQTPPSKLSAGPYSSRTQSEAPSRGSSFNSYLYRSSSKVRFATDEAPVPKDKEPSVIRYNSFRSLSKSFVHSSDTPQQQPQAWSGASTPEMEQSYTPGRNDNFNQLARHPTGSRAAMSIASSGFGGGSTVSKKKPNQRLKGKWSFYGLGKSTQDRIAEKERKKFQDARHRQIGDSADYDMQVRVGSRPDSVASREAAEKHLTIRASKGSIHDFIHIEIVDTLFAQYFEKFEPSLRCIFEVYCGLQNPSNISRCSFRNFHCMMKDINVFDDYIGFSDVYLQLLCVVERRQRAIDDPYRSKGTTLKEIARLNEQSRSFEQSGFCDLQERDDRGTRLVVKYLNFEEWFEGLLRVSELTRHEFKIANDSFENEHDKDTEKRDALSHADEFLTYRVEPLVYLKAATKEELTLFYEDDVQKCVDSENSLLQMLFSHYSDMTHFRGDVYVEDSTIHLRRSANGEYSMRSTDNGTKPLKQEKLLEYVSFLKLCHDVSVVPKLVHTTVVMSSFQCAARLEYVNMGDTFDFSARESVERNTDRERLSFEEFQFAVFLLAQRGFSQPYLDKKFARSSDKIQALFAWIRGAPEHPIEQISRAEWERGYSYRGRQIDGGAAPYTGSSALYCIGSSKYAKSFSRKARGNDRAYPSQEPPATEGKEPEERTDQQEEEGGKKESALEALCHSPVSTAESWLSKRGKDEMARSWECTQDTRQQALSLIIQQMDYGCSGQQYKKGNTSKSDDRNEYRLPSPPKHVQVPYYPSEKETFTAEPRKRTIPPSTQPQRRKTQRTPTTTKAPGEDYFIQRMSAAKTERTRKGWLDYLRNGQLNLYAGTGKKPSEYFSGNTTKSEYPSLQTASRATHRTHEPCLKTSTPVRSSTRPSSKEKQRLSNSIQNLSRQVAHALANADSSKDDYISPRSLD